jgi:hypothetical protein
MINEEVLKEKLKYLIMIESKDKFEILNFDVDFEYDNPKSENKQLTGYLVDIKFDYHGSISETSYEMGDDISNMMEMMSNYLKKYIITSDGKIRQNLKVMVDRGVIWEIEYLFDEKHIFNTSFRVSYDI